MNAVLQPDVSINTLEAGTIDAAAFDHESHVYAAWLYLERWPLHEAIGRFCTALRRLTVKLGAEAKYHETMSWFFLLLINQRRTTTKATSWIAFRQENADLIRDFRATLSRYYSQEVLGSDQAQQHFLLPDKLSQ